MRIAKSTTFSGRADGSNVLLGIQSGGDSLSFVNENCSSEEIESRECSEFPPRCVLIRQLGLQEWVERIVRKNQQQHDQRCNLGLESETTIVQNSPTDPLRWTSLNVQKSLTDTVLLNPIQKIPMNEVSIPKIAMNATTVRSLLQPPDFLVLYRTLVKDGALPTGHACEPPQRERGCTVADKGDDSTPTSQPRET